MELKDLVKEINPKANLEIIKKAYNLAESSHKEQKRESGDDYIQHCLETALILAKLDLDENTIAASLLHDVIEDTNFDLEDFRKKLNKETFSLVEGIVKIDQLMENVDRNKEENVRKMLIATTKDIRVLLIKLADRLHNMRTLYALNPLRRKKIAKETLSIYTPIAYRFGLNNIKWELEDLSFKYLEPKFYQELKEKISLKRSEREQIIKDTINIIEEKLKENNIKAEIYGRPKHFYSIHQKIKNKSYKFENIYDLLAIRIIVNKVEKCYEVLGMIHTMYKPLMKHFEDYIANPKSNNYQSIHTIVSSNKNFLEVQIRTQKMHENAEEGISAHWQYKGLQTEKKFDKQLSWMRQLLDKELLEKIKIDLFGNDIFCFTPKGDIIEIPKESTPIDFAYAVHTSIGEKCTGARVNDKFVNLKHKLKTGDIIEIQTKKDHKPSRDWLNFVKSSRAIGKIRHTLRLIQGIPSKNIVKKDLSKDPNQNIIDVSGMKNVEITIANCCNPLPGDKIIGFIAQNKKIKIHKIDCKKAINIKRKSMTVKWIQDFETMVTLKVDAIDRVGLFADILNTIASTGTTVKLASAKTIGNNFAECELNMNFTGLKHLRDTINRLQRIKDISRIKLG